MKPAQPEFNMGSEPFRLVPETATDFDRLAAEARRRDQDRGLSAGEKRMLAKARQILVSEIALALKADEEHASGVLDEVLAS